MISLWSLIGAAFRGFAACLRRDQRGSAVVLVAAGMTVLLGFGGLVLDYGQIVTTRAHLQNATDAAALAGVQEYAMGYGDAAAYAATEQYLHANGVKPGEYDICLPERIKVTAWREVPFSFARVLGLTSAMVKVESQAHYYTASALRGAAPLAVRDREYAYGESVMLKVADWKDGWLGEGNFGALRLGAQGANVYRNNLRYGYQGRLAVGDIVETEPGNMSGPTEEVIQYLLNTCPHEPKCTIDHWERGCPRILIIPVCRFYSAGDSGVTQVQVVGFAAFLVQEVTGSGNDCTIRGYYIQTVTAGDGNWHTGDYGVRIVKLVR